MTRLILLLVLTLSSIAGPTVSSADESAPLPFDPFHVPGVYWPELAPYLKTGSGEIEGRFTAKTKLFGEIGFPNTRVDLLPAVPISEWIIRSTGYNLEHDDYKKRDPMPDFPNQLTPYEKWTITDGNGYFKFSNLPDGSYFVFGTARRTDLRHPSRYTTDEQTAANGDTVTTLEKTEGLKELSDLVTIAASATVDSKNDHSLWTVARFDVMGEYTCCKAEI
jgi:hypothetical protein